jgi:hypothetical protein
MWRLIFYSIASLINLSIWLVIIIGNIKKIYITFLYLTIISYTSATFYLFTIWIFELRLFLNRNNLEKLKGIKESRCYIHLRERMFKFVFTASATVCTSYWVLVLGGESVMIAETRFPNILMNIHVHLLIGIQVVLELILNERKHFPDLFLVEYIILISGVIVYSSFITFVSKYFELAIYPFLTLPIPQVIAINIFLCIVSFNVYQLYHYILHKKNGQQSVSRQVSFNFDKLSETLT